MTTFPNQRIVISKKPAYHTNFLVIGNYELMEAAVLLTRSELLLYLYFCGMPSGYKIAVSKVRVCRICKFGEDSYKRGMKKLIELGFLVPQTSGSNVYTFTGSRQRVVSEEAASLEDTVQMEKEKEEEEKRRKEWENLWVWKDEEEIEEIRKEKQDEWEKEIGGKR